jgi:hypothetical protein
MILEAGRGYWCGQWPLFTYNFSDTDQILTIGMPIDAPRYSTANSAIISGLTHFGWFIIFMILEACRGYSLSPAHQLRLYLLYPICLNDNPPLLLFWNLLWPWLGWS